MAIVGPQFHWLGLHIKLHGMAGKQCVFSAQRLEKITFSETFAGISTLNSWTTCSYNNVIRDTIESLSRDVRDIQIEKSDVKKLKC